MKKFHLFIVAVLLTFSLTGCFSDSPEDVATTFIQALFGKSEDGKPTETERLETIKNLLTAKNQNKFGGFFGLIIHYASTAGLYKPFYVAEDPSEPSSDSYRVILAHLPKDSFVNPKKLMAKRDVYFKIILQKEDGDWKVDDLKEIREKDIPKHEDIDWQEADPF